MVKSVYITDGIANVDETDTSNQKTTVGRRLHLTEDQSEDYTRQKINQRRLHLTKDQSEDYTRQKTNQKTTLGRRLHSTEDQSEEYIKDGKVLVHLGFRSKVLPGPLTDISAWWVSAPQAHSRVSNINFDI
jgi:uncharacterized membrane-anchored protein